MKYYIKDNENLLYTEDEARKIILKKVTPSDLEDIIVEYLFTYRKPDEIIGLLPPQMQKDILDTAVGAYIDDDFSEVSAEEALELIWGGDIDFANKPTK